jgi:uncharacterized membrane protein YjjB (DUF3815 family)
MSELHSGPSNINRAAASTIGMAVAVLVAWVFQQATGIQPPAEVATAFGTLVMALVGALYSKLGGVG